MSRNQSETLPIPSGSWLADGVREIERITKAGTVVVPKTIELPGERPGVYGTVTPGPAGSALEIKRHLAEPGWHDEYLDDPTQLIAFIKSMQDRGVEPKNGAVYISEEEITYVFDFNDRRNRATVDLRKSEGWKVLENRPGPLDQRSLIRLLRITFDRALPAGSNLVSLIRNVKWKTDGTADINLQRGKEAIGRQILNEAAGINDFPDEFALTLNVFENAAQTSTVRMALEIYPDVGKFEIIPFPDEVQHGVRDTLSWLQGDIAAAGVPTFIGSPAAK